MALKPAKGAFNIKWKFSPLMFPELRQWVVDYNAKLLVLDSLMTIAGGDISPKDAEFGLLIYRLNQLAGELGITIICLHHVVKGGGKQSREITKDDIYGTAYVYNGASDAWGLWRSREDGSNEEIFNLRCLKSRSGLVDVGTTYQFDGDEEDRRVTFRGMADRTVTLDEIHHARDRICAFLKARAGAAFTPRQLSHELQINSTKYAAKLCSELFDRRATTGVERKAVGSTRFGGRPSYGYLIAASDENVIYRVEKVKPPKPSAANGSQRKGFSTPGAQPAEGSAPSSTPFPPRSKESERERRESVEERYSSGSLLRAREVPSPGSDQQLPDGLQSFIEAFDGSICDD
jgi:hypothetical protein